jgi:hypothetical protein
MVEISAVLRWRIPILLSLAILLVALPVAASGCSQAPAGDSAGGVRLYPVMISGKYAYADATGRIVIPRQFTDAYPFHEGLAVVTRDEAGGGGSGYIDVTGNIVLEPYGSEFSEGLASSDNGQGGLHFIDRTGEVVIPGPFATVPSLFKNGLAIVEVWPDPEARPLVGVIDTAGRWVAPARYRQISDFSEGLAAVQTSDGLWGYIDTTGREVVAPQFKEVEGGGLAAGPFSDGLAAVRTDAGCGFIDQGGAWVIPAQYERALGFSEGLAAVKKDGLMGFIDRTGAWMIPARLEATWEFHEGLAAAQAGGLWGVIDHSGTWVVPAQFYVMGRFSEGLAPVGTEAGDWGYIDTTGRMVVTPQYRDASAFEDGIATVRPSGTTQYLIDRTGKRLTPSTPAEARGE